MPNSPLHGTFLKSEVAWLEGHAVEKDGEFVCRTNGALIMSRTVHRYRAAAAKSDTPFVGEHDWPRGTGVSDGVMRSFTTLWCRTCDVVQREHPSVSPSEFVCLTAP